MRRQLMPVVLLMSLAVLTGCKAWQQRSLRAQIQETETQKAASQQKIKMFADNVSAVQSQARSLENRIQARQSQTRAYMRDHPLAVTCMAAVGYTVASDNLFSAEVNQMINTGTVLCLAGMIFGESFGDEVAQVVAEIERSSDEVKSLQSQVAALRPKIAAETAVWREEKNSYEALETKIAGLERELRQLE